MGTMMKSGFLWQFAGGFLLGAVGLVAMQPAEANRGLVHDVAVAIHAGR